MNMWLKSSSQRMADSNESVTGFLAMKGFSVKQTRGWIWDANKCAGLCNSEKDWCNRRKGRSVKEINKKVAVRQTKDALCKNGVTQPTKERVALWNKRMGWWVKQTEERLCNADERVLSETNLRVVLWNRWKGGFVELKRGWLSGTNAKDAFVELTVIEHLFGMTFHLIQSIHHRYMTNVRLSMVQNMGIYLLTWTLRYS